jgi:hypothetical protein
MSSLRATISMALIVAGERLSPEPIKCCDCANTAMNA